MVRTCVCEVVNRVVAERRQMYDRYGIPPVNESLILNCRRSVLGTRFRAWDVCTSGPFRTTWAAVSSPHIPIPATNPQTIQTAIHASSFRVVI